MAAIKQADSDRLRIGVIGTGHWGKNYLRLFNSLPACSLTAIAEKDPDKREQHKTLYPSARLFPDARSIIRSSLCDAVIVATPASTHYSIIREALIGGLDVLAEKPLTLSVSEAKELEKIAKNKKRVLMVAHTFLFNPSIQALKRSILTGILGKTYYLKSQRTHLGLIREDVNAVWDLAPHDVSIFLYLLEEQPCAIQAMGRRVLHANREDAAFINMTFPSGVIAHIHVSWADSNKERRMDVVGSKARISFNDLDIQEPIRIYYKGISVETGKETTFGEFKYLLRDGEIVSPKIPVQEPLKVLCESFLLALKTRKVPLSGARFGREVVEVLSGIDASIKKSRARQC